MKNTLLLLAATTVVSQAATTAIAHFRMGEDELAGTGLGNTPTTLINSIGGVNNMTIQGSSNAPIVATPSPAAGSTHALDMSQGTTYFSVASNHVGANDGFLVEGWVKASVANNGSVIGTVFSYGHGGGGILVAQHGDVWSTFVGGIGWSGNGGTVEVGVWTHLAIMQTTADLAPSLWVNGVNMGAIAENDNTVNGSAIGDQWTGGGHQFQGLVDDVWFSSVNNTFDAANDFQSFTAVPEPSSLLLFGLGGLGLLMRRRK